MKDNKLIAEFMELEYAPKDKNGTRVTFGNRIPLLYHKSWDWLMTVVEKILDLSFQDDGDPEDFYSIRDCVPDINHTHKAVVEFIKQYNNGRK